MNKYRFDFTYSVVVMANNENEALSKTTDILALVSEQALKLWLTTHYKVETVIESGGNLADAN